MKRLFLSIGMLLSGILFASPLHDAIRTYATGAQIAALIEKGYSVYDTDSEGMTALHVAMEAENESCVVMLVIYLMMYERNPAAFKVRDALGRTPEQCAATSDIRKTYNKLVAECLVEIKAKEKESKKGCIIS